MPKTSFDIILPYLHRINKKYSNYQVRAVPESEREGNKAKHAVSQYEE
jgi:hypothetical protein